MMKSDRLWAVADQAELVSRAQGADHTAFAELMRRTTGALLRIATSMLKNHHLAEQEVQNAYFNLGVPHCGQPMPDAPAPPLEGHIY